MKKRKCQAEKKLEPKTVKDLNELPIEYETLQARDDEALKASRKLEFKVKQILILTVSCSVWLKAKLSGKSN